MQPGWTLLKYSANVRTLISPPGVMPGSKTRGAAWITLWEEMLDRRVKPSDFTSLALTALPREDTEQNVQLVLSYLDDAFWGFLSDSARRSTAAKLEQTLRAGLDHSPSSS